MILLPGEDVLRTAAERFALALLVDASRLVPVEDASANVVRLAITDDAVDDDLRTLHDARWGIAHADGIVRIPRAALRRIAAIAGAEREQRSAARDRHDRVPSSENELVIAGIEREPVISRAAIELRHATIAAAGARPVRLVPPWPDGKRWAAALSHDLDVVALWPLFAALRVVELARKGELARIARVAGGALRAASGAPVRDGVAAILDGERGHAATWFVLCGTPTLATFRAGDLTYRLESRAARRILAALAEHGHEIALHGSLETTHRDGAFAAQRARLASLAGREPVGVRQHFLRMRLGDTRRAMLEAGFTYDSTMGFPDRNGFRLGLADVVATWDAERERATALLELPFCWMDRAQSKYRGEENPDTWVDDALALARTCREVEGLWVGIWHPNVTLSALGFPGAAEAFGRLVRALAADAPWFASMCEIARWRLARASVRVQRVDAEGRVSAVAARAWSAPIPLEDGHGATRECVTG